jgi:hypothetical protein
MLTTEVARDVPIENIDPSRAILFFNVETSNSDPMHGMVRGQITGPTTLRFVRVGTGAIVSIQWYVAELVAARVQRGTLALVTERTDIPLTAVDPAKTFALVSMSNDGTIYNFDELVRARIESPTNLELTFGFFQGNTTSVDWQVVTLDTASVTSGNLTFASDQPVASIDVGADPNSFLVASWLTNSVATNIGIGQTAIRGRIAGPTVVFEREAIGVDIEMSYFLVTLLDGSQVQSGTRSFLPTDISHAVPLGSAVDPSRTLALLSGNQRGGSTPYNTTATATDDNPGLSWFTTTFTTTTELAITRALTPMTAPAETGWFVVELAP